MHTRTWLFASLFAVAVLLQSCIGASSQLETLDITPELPVASGDDLPEKLPQDGLQPWETIDGNGHAIPADGRGVSSINAGTDFTPGVERFIDSGEVSEFGEALRILAGAPGSSSWAMYRVPLAGAQPGIVSVDANMLVSKAEYYVGLSNYGSGRWQWQGPFTDNHVRIPAAGDESADYTSGLGSTFVVIMADAPSALDIIGIGVNQFDPVDTTAPATPAGFSLTPVANGLELNWSPVLEADLAGYEIFHSDQTFINPQSAGVRRVPSLEGSTKRLLGGLNGRSFVALRAVDFSGNSSSLTTVLDAVPLEGVPPTLMLTADTPSGGINSVIGLAAAGADSYDWDLDGDGVFEVQDDSTGNQPASTSAAGLIRPRVRAADITGERVALGGLSLIITGNTRPVASAVASPQSGDAPLNVTFTGTAEDAEDDASELSYAWDFDGDGIYENGTDTLTPAVQTYVDPGNFNAKFRVTDSEGAWDVDTVAVSVTANLAPLAVLNSESSRGPAPFFAEFDASASLDIDGSITKYEWDYDGDNVFDADTGLLPFSTFIYADPGSTSAAVRVTDDSGLSSTATLEITALGVTTRPVADPGSGDDYTSIALVNGNPAICYRGVSGQLMYVRATDSTGSQWGTPVAVSLADNVFENNLMIVNGRPAVSYYDSVDDDLMYAQAMDADGASWNSPVSPDSTGFTGGSNSLAVVNSRPAISYSEGSPVFDLKYVRALDADGVGWGTPITVDSTDNVGGSCVMAVAAGNPSVSYRNSSTGDLQFIRATDADGASWNSPVIVDDSGNADYISMVIVDGNPAISYFEGDNDDLQYVRALDSIGSDWGMPVSPDNVDNTGWYTSMAVINGRPAITYIKGSGDILRYVHAGDAHGNTWHEPLDLDASGDAGLEPSIMMLDDHAAVSGGNSAIPQPFFVAVYD